MRIVAGADHNGYLLKDTIVAKLREQGFEVKDLGTNGPERVLVDSYALGVGESVADGSFDTGLLVCGTGQGMAIFANRVKGVRAAHCNDVFTARLARRNNDANVLCMGSDFMGADLALAILEEWINTPYGKKEDDTLQRLADIESGTAPRESAPGV